MENIDIDPFFLISYVSYVDLYEKSDLYEQKSDDINRGLKSDIAISSEKASKKHIFHIRFHV